MSNPEPEAESPFLAEFLDDYFAECDEHLAIVRRNLLALEGSINKPRISRAPIDELFRSFHTLKGVSGMMGVGEAERLAHQIESYLRALRDTHIILTAEGFDALISGTRLMEQVIASRRAHGPMPDTVAILERIASAISGGTPASDGPDRPDTACVSIGHALSDEESSKLAEAIESGKKLWRFEFVPLPDLLRRGINVNVIRARLQEIGELIIAAPRITPQSGISFEFVVAGDADETTLAAWRGDGLTYAVHEPVPADFSPRGADKESVISISHPATPLSSPNVVRVDLARLDDLMRMVGDLVISRSRLDEGLKRLENNLASSEWRPIQETNLAMERQLRDLREGVMRIRMVPVGQIFERMRFAALDLARDHQKKITLELHGQQTEIDKLLVERMMDPILHLVRNAVSHGVETPGERLAMGKPAEGRISLRASAAAELVVIEVEDDGRGIAAEQVAKRAQAAGLISAESDLDNTTLLDLICAPGFSTRDEADRGSGRGVGLNVVKNTILGLGGSFELSTEPGRGARFTIQLPLTLAIADALIVTAGGQRFAVPQSSVREVIEVDPAGVTALENNEIISYRGKALPLLRLAALFRLVGKARSILHAFVVGSGLNQVAIAVDRILAQREIVVRAINDPLVQVAGIAGATELGDGHIVLILDAAALARGARNTG